MNPRPLPDQPRRTSFSGDWAAWPRLKDWWNCMEQHVIPGTGRDGVRWLELGSHEGRSAVATAMMLDGPGSQVTCLDLWGAPSTWCINQGGAVGESEQKFNDNVKESGVTERIRKIKGHWIFTLDSIHNEKFHGAYIDADHTGVSVLTQSMIIWDMLEPGGFMVWDDYLLAPYDKNTPPVATGVNFFLGLKHGQFDILHKGWQIFIRKR